MQPQSCVFAAESRGGVAADIVAGMVRLAWVYVLLTSAVLYGQGGTVDVKGSVGYTGFLDDSAIGHLQTGGAVRIYVTQRFSIEPEFQYLYQNGLHHDITFVPNVAWDFRSGRVVPYVAGGVGWMRGTFQFPGRSFSSTELFAEAGGGVKFYAGKGWFVASDVRVGWEPHLRVSVSIGHTFRN